MFNLFHKAILIKQFDFLSLLYGKINQVYRPRQSAIVTILWKTITLPPRSVECIYMTWYIAFHSCILRINYYTDIKTRLP